MAQLVLRLIFIVTVVILGLETLVILGLNRANTHEAPGLVMPDSSIMLGQQVRNLAQFRCWGIVEFTASCQVTPPEVTTHTVSIAIHENTIMMATYRANNLLALSNLVKHWGDPTTVEHREHDIYLSWEHFVYGIITPDSSGAVPSYTLTTWAEV